MRRRQKVLKNVKIDRIAAEGRGLGLHEGKVVFVDYAIPGDEVDVFVQKNKKDFAQGKIDQLLHPSELRVDHFCSHFGLCGGCRWQHITYDQQLAFKQHIVEEAFKRTGKMPNALIEGIAGCHKTKGYRNKMEYTFSQRGWLTKEQIQSGEMLDRRSVGLHVPGQFMKVVNIDHCYLQDETGNQIRNGVLKFARNNDLEFYDHPGHEGFLRNLTIRNTSIGEIMVLVSFGKHHEEQIEMVMQYLKAAFPTITSLNYVINTKGNDTIYDLEVVHYSGNPFIKEQLGEVIYKVGPKSFFQTNSYQAKVLYDIIVEFAQLQAHELVYDLYTGIGSIALYVADQCKEVIGVETVPEAIEDARINAELNSTTNVTFHAGSSERILSDEFVTQNGQPDVVITDPPRAGMHKDVVEFLVRVKPKRIVYVSCNPVTQARDIHLLSGVYQMSKARPVDMFPHTYHVENVALLELKDATLGS